MRHPLLEGLIDYAGLFPPAKLPLDAAWPRYLEHLRAPEAWMLSRFVIPATQLPDLSRHATQADAPFRLTVLGTGGSDPAAFAVALETDLGAIRRFHDAPGAFARADTFEVRLPETLFDTLQEVPTFLDRTAHRLSDAALTSLFFEVPLTDPGPSALPFLLRSFRVHNDAGGPLTLGLKLRTGGLTPEAFPSPEALARALVEAHRAGVPFKATAGLHHPVREHRAEVGTEMHGFLNVFGEAALLHALDLDHDTVAELLREENPASFRLGGGSFAWRTLEATPEEIRAARSHFAASFGSCSFDEPVEDLQALGIL